MKVEELFSSIRNTLQDSAKNYWDDSELLMYYNECVRNMAAERMENKTTATMILDPEKKEYNTTGILRYIRCEDSNGTERRLYPDDMSGDDDKLGVIIQNYDRVYVNNPEIASSLTFTVVAFPQESNLTSNVRIGDESAIKYYVLSKAYEKDTDVENFNKCQYFYGKYLELMRNLKQASSANYKARTATTTKSYFY